jgi:SSS family solute:Na+ symporter
LYLLANIIEIILGWQLWISLIVAAAVVLTYTTLGGLSAAIYNEVLQFFVIVAALAPLTIIGLNKLGGYGGLKDRIAATAGGSEQLSSWPGTNLTGIESPFWSVVGLIFGLGFVLSFGYWTTNFVEVQRAMASNSISAGQRAPIIGAFPKMFIPFIVIFPGMIAGVLVTQVAEAKASGDPDFDYNNSLLYLIRDLLPNGMLGLAIAGLLAAFMAGNGRQHLGLQHRVLVRPVADVRREGPTGRVLPRGRPDRDSGGDGDRHRYGDVRSVVHQHHELPPNAVRLLQRALVRHLHPGHVLETDERHRGWAGLVAGTAAAVLVGVLSEDALGGLSVGVINLSGQGAGFAAAAAAFVVDIAVSVAVTMVTKPREESELRGLVYSLTPKEDFHDENEGDLAWYQQPLKLAGIGLGLVVALNIIFW